MKRQLKRIEQTLQQLERGSVTGTLTPPLPSSEQEQVAAAQSAAVSQTLLSPSISFQVERQTAPPPSGSGRSLAGVDPSAQSFPPTMAKVPAPPVQPFNLAALAEPLDANLPKYKLPSFTSHRHDTNPDLALTLLRDILAVVEEWRSQLQEVVRQMQDLYREGPIVDGWLECFNEKVHTTTAVLRHAEVDRLMDCVEEICHDPSTMHPEYRLCGLDTGGQIWSCPCPADQVANIGLAIARHQKLQQLLIQKQQLEYRLGRMTTELVQLHGQIPASE